MKRNAADIRHGDFTHLAEQYSRYRPGYSSLVLDAALALAGKPPRELDHVDVGAGTGIWTRLVAARGCRSTAVEPNERMRAEGVKASRGADIRWTEGTGEATGLPEGCCDLLTMASCFHWMDFDRAMAETARLVRPGGLFMALWNPREVEANPLTAEIEAELGRLAPEITRVSSGRSGFCDALADRLRALPMVQDVLYMEARHVELQSPERYVGLWESVNDVRVQAGPERFAAFLDFVRSRVEGLPHIEAAYLTRAWLARLKD